MRGRREEGGPKEVESAEGGGPHLVKAHFRRAVEHMLQASTIEERASGEGFLYSCMASSSLDTRPD